MFLFFCFFFLFLHITCHHSTLFNECNRFQFFSCLQICWPIWLTYFIFQLWDSCKESSFCYFRFLSPPLFHTHTHTWLICLPHICFFSFANHPLFTINRLQNVCLCICVFVCQCVGCIYFHLSCVSNSISLLVFERDFYRLILAVKWCVNNLCEINLKCDKSYFKWLSSFIYICILA